MPSPHPTPFPDLNAVLRDLAGSARAVVGDRLVAASLQGSFATGDFDRDSDVDFVIAVDGGLSAGDVDRLQEMHARLHALASPWAQHLEGSYFPADVLADLSARGRPLWFLDNGSSTLVLAKHCNTAVVRRVLHEHGIALAGPSPATLVGPVPADVLRAEVAAKVRDWAEGVRSGRYEIATRWSQPYVVITYCRMLHTIATGRVQSKPAAVRWAKGALEPRWEGLIGRAWGDRPDPTAKVRLPADPGEVADTLAFVAYAVERVEGGGPETESG